MSLDKNISLVSLGCAKNLVDSEILIGGLKKEGFNLVSNTDKADVIIVNTCGFLDTAREESVDTILDCASLKNKFKLKKIISYGMFF